MTKSPRVLLHFNAGLEYGMGHLMRSSALGAEAVAQGWTVVVAGDLDALAAERWRDLVPDSTLILVPRAEQTERLPALAQEYSPDVVHIDSYWPESDALGQHARFLSNMQDGSFGTRPAQLAIDANLNAEDRFSAPALSERHLAGVSCALIRPQVLRHRSDSRSPREPRRLLVVLGGTDPHAVTPLIVEHLGELDAKPQITVIAPQAVAEEVKKAVDDSDATFTVLPFVEDLPSLADAQDLVITAAGTSVWDFACMGLPMGLVCVTENQELGYRAAAGARLGIPLGEPPHDDIDDRLNALDRTLASESALASLSQRGIALVDGLGAWRVVSAWAHRTAFAPIASKGFTARLATVSDARLLLDWRNDPATRQVSRSSDSIAWDDHVMWLERVITDPERVLLVIESPEGAVGTVRWDHLDGIDWEASITLAPEHRGRGNAVSVLHAGETALPDPLPRRLIATIHEDNAASRRLFERAGYLPHRGTDENGFAQYAKLLVASAGEAEDRV